MQFILVVFFRKYNYSRTFIILLSDYENLSSCLKDLLQDKKKYILATNMSTCIHFFGTDGLVDYIRVRDRERRKSRQHIFSRRIEEDDVGKPIFGEGAVRKDSYKNFFLPSWHKGFMFLSSHSFICKISIRATFSKMNWGFF